MTKDFAIVRNDEPKSSSASTTILYKLLNFWFNKQDSHVKYVMSSRYNHRTRCIEHLCCVASGA